MKKYASLQERILANSVASETCSYNGERCWDWTGATQVNRSGKRYPKMSIRVKRGPNKGKVRTVLVHRVVITLFKRRKLSKRQVAMHLCNNSICVNPNHLSGGTQRKNVRQCVVDGRHRNGVTGPLDVNHATLEVPAYSGADPSPVAPSSCRAGGAFVC